MGTAFTLVSFGQQGNCPNRHGTAKLAVPRASWERMCKPNSVPPQGRRRSFL